MKHVEYNLSTVPLNGKCSWAKKLSFPLAKLECLSQDLFLEKNLGASDIC